MIVDFATNLRGVDIFMDIEYEPDEPMVVTGWGYGDAIEPIQGTFEILSAVDEYGNDMMGEFIMGDKQLIENRFHEWMSSCY